MGNHTQGPWKVQKNQRGEWGVYTPDERGPMLLNKVQMTEANARLIAATPDLLEACKLASLLLRKLGLAKLNTMNFNPQASTVDYELAQAIAKAEGK